MKSPVWSILVCKIPEFWRWKLWAQNFVPFDSGNILIKESKKPGFTFSVELRTKFAWSHDLNQTFLNRASNLTPYLFSSKNIKVFQWLSYSNLTPCLFLTKNIKALQWLSKSKFLSFITKKNPSNGNGNKTRQFSMGRIQKWHSFSSVVKYKGF